MIHVHIFSFFGFFTACLAVSCDYRVCVYKQTVDTSDDDGKVDEDGKKRKKRQLGQVNGEEIDIEKLKEWLGQEGKLCDADVMAIIETATKILAAEPTLMQLSTPITSLFSSISSHYLSFVSLTLFLFV